MTERPPVWGGKQPRVSVWCQPSVSAASSRLVWAQVGTLCPVPCAAEQASRACGLSSEPGAVMPTDEWESERLDPPECQPLAPKPTPPASGCKTLPGNVV